MYGDKEGTMNFTQTKQITRKINDLYATLRGKIDDYDFISYRVKDAYWWIRHRLFDRYDLVRTTLPKGGYCDIDHRMLYANMALLVEYVEVEDCFGRIDFKGGNQEDIKKEIEIIYSWWKNYESYKILEDHLCHMWDTFNPERLRFNFDETGRKPVTRQEDYKILSDFYFDEHTKIETRRENEEQDMLTRLIKIRQYLWT